MAGKWQKAVVFIISIVTFTGIQAQTINWGEWRQTQLDSARQSAAAKHMDSTCAQVIFYSNLARLNGPLFVKTILKPYAEHNNIKKTRYLQSLITTLNSQKALTPLIPNGQLTNKAQSYASLAGKRGITGHYQFKQRMQPLMKEYSTVGENCDYGNDDALDIVMSLLIDEDIRDYGHRKNILSRSFKYLGVGIAPHKKYRINCVMDFGG